MPVNFITVNPNYLITSEDLYLLVNASIAARQIFSQDPVKALYSIEVAPGSAVQTPADFRTYVHDNFSAVGHFIGSVPMLPRDMGGAVDTELMVYGINGVRVAGRNFSQFSGIVIILISGP